MPKDEHGLNARQRKFAELLAADIPHLDAYVEAGYQFRSLGVLHAAASRLQWNPAVRACVRLLRAKAGLPEWGREAEARRETATTKRRSARATWHANRVAVADQRKETILRIREKREYLAKVVRTPIGEIDDTSDLSQDLARTSQTVGAGEGTRETEKVRMPDKLEAIRLDSLLAGDLPEARSSESGPAVGLVITEEMLRDIQARRAASWKRMCLSSPIDDSQPGPP